MTWQNTIRFANLAWGKPIVYGWFRGEVCLYIGMSATGLARPLCNTHHRIGKELKMRATDKLCWSEQESIVHARLMEKFLIRNLQPIFNCTNGIEFRRLLAKYKLKHVPDLYHAETVRSLSSAPST